MDSEMTKVDLHVHSKFSKRPAQWILQKLSCPESFTEPAELYKIAVKRGMSLVTITDHNSISGCLEIAGLPGTFISEEVTAYFPEDRCKVHVLVYDIDERIHEDIQKVRENIYELAAYLRQNRIHCGVAHPLFSINDRMTLERLEQLLLLFRNFEINGARGVDQNGSIQRMVSRLTPENILKLADKHGIAPAMPEPWRKNLICGSDDHSSLTIGRSYTQVESRGDVDAFFEGVDNGMAEVAEWTSTPLTLARHIYGIAYQFYKTKFDLDRFAGKDVLIRFLDHSLMVREEESFGLLSRLQFIWNHRKWPKNRKSGPVGIQELLRVESGDLIWNDPDLREIAESKNADPKSMDAKWFFFVNRISNKVLLHFANHILDHLSGANVFNVFQSVGSAGGLYTLLAPYFISFVTFKKGRELSELVDRRFLMEGEDPESEMPLKVAHFTDTFYEVNGVAGTLQQQVKAALKTGKNLTVVTCNAGARDDGAGVRNFEPVGVYELPEYPEQKLQYPPFLEMLEYCYENRFTHIHSATPGPIGIAALAIARILRLPIYGTYHTALPQYAQHLTNDSSIEDLMWKYTIWYYDQMDLVFAPSQSTAAELAGRGIPWPKIRVYPRGIDTARFHPSKKNGILEERYGVDPKSVKLLYVGRVSKEKDLVLLENVFKKAVESTREKIELIVVGDGPYLNEMRGNLDGLPCVFTGYLKGEELASVYASSDFFVFPSATDTFGNVVLEAQASGLPVIVSDSGGPRENMLHLRTGLIARAGDLESFLFAVRFLTDDADRRGKMGKAARRYMEERSFDSAVDETWKIYHERRVA